MENFQNKFERELGREEEIERFRMEIQAIKDEEERKEKTGESFVGHLESVDASLLTKEDAEIYRWMQNLRKVDPGSVSKEEYERQYLILQQYNDSVYGADYGKEPDIGESRKLFADFITNKANRFFDEVQMKLCK